jgi:hypothetical protein
MHCTDVSSFQTQYLPSVQQLPHLATSFTKFRLAKHLAPAFAIVHKQQFPLPHLSLVESSAPFSDTLSFCDVVTGGDECRWGATRRA